MPANGVPLSPPSHILSNLEILHLSQLFVSQGVNKIRLTGGEPTLRKGLPDLVRGIGQLRDQGLKIIGMTSNGVALGGKSDNGGKLRELVDGGLTHLNLR
jgi:cyclic pyranopterin phosphate synthase